MYEVKGETVVKILKGYESLTGIKVKDKREARSLIAYAIAKFILESNKQ